MNVRGLHGHTLLTAACNHGDLRLHASALGGSADVNMRGREYAMCTRYHAPRAGIKHEVSLQAPNHQTLFDPGCRVALASDAV